MEMKDSIKEIIEDKIIKDKINWNSKAKDFLNSIDYIKFIVEVENVFDVEIDDDLLLLDENISINVLINKITQSVLKKISDM